MLPASCFLPYAGRKLRSAGSSVGCSTSRRGSARPCVLPSSACSGVCGAFVGSVLPANRTLSSPPPSMNAAAVNTGTPTTSVASAAEIAALRPGCFSCIGVSSPLLDQAPSGALDGCRLRALGGDADVPPAAMGDAVCSPDEQDRSGHSPPRCSRY